LTTARSSRALRLFTRGENFDLYGEAESIHVKHRRA
jgi:hypothetical protein